MTFSFSNKICSIIFSFLLKLLSIFPLKWIHFLGSIVGEIFHFFKPKVKQMLISNLKVSGLYPDSIALDVAVKINMREMGKTILESMAIWGSSQKKVLSWIQQVDNFQVIEQALKKNSGIIFLTPHIGSFEIASIFYASKNPMTVLYRPSRKKCIDKWIKNGRSKGDVTLAPTDRSGVKSLLLALKRGQAIGILPDQIASKGDGEWANFFSKPTYTMTLVGKLAVKTDATVIMAVTERLPGGKGFIIHLELIDRKNIENPSRLNEQLEYQIAKFPLQYMWNYDRYKRP